MKPTYSEAFIDQAVSKALARGTRPVTEISRDLNVPYHTLRKWLARMSMSKRGESRERRPGDWSPEERLQALQETHGLSEEAVQAWCREKGLFAHHLSAWRTAFCATAESPAGAESRALKAENAKLKRELARKEKALAEAAALLILQKKYQALWEDEDK